MSEYERNQFARLLKYYLMMNDKTQSDMVHDLKFDKSTVSGWCNGTRVPKVDVIIQIANYLHVNVGDLIIESDSSEQSYYLDNETAKLAQEIKDNDNILFDAYKSTKKDKLLAYAKKLMELEKMENGDDI